MENCRPEIKELRWIRILLIILALPVVVIILKNLQAIFIPLIFAIFTSFIFAPMRSWMSSKKVPLWLTLLIMMLIILLFFALVGGVVYAAIASFVQQVPKYQARLAVMLQDGMIWLESVAAQMDLATSRLPNLDFQSMLTGSSISIPRFLSDTMGNFMSFGSTLFLAGFFLLFIVAEAGKLEQRLKAVLSETENQKTMGMINRIQTQIQKYFINKSLISLMTAAVGMAIIWLFGVDFVIVSGLLIFVLNFIPNIGSIIATLFPILVCLLQYGLGIRLVFVAALLTSTQMFFGNYFEPRLMGDRLNLTPIMILISLVFWGYVWGIVGMVLAVPITSAINIILKQLDDKSVISAIISDR